MTCLAANLTLKRAWGKQTCPRSWKNSPQPASAGFYTRFWPCSWLLCSGCSTGNTLYSIRFRPALQKVYERNGGRSPAWLANWSHWTMLTPIERSFETINRSLRLLGEAPAFFATPTERAKSLEKQLPTATNDIETLLEQHQASLFTPQPGNAGLARRASLNIWMYTIKTMIQKFLYGRSTA